MDTTITKQVIETVEPTKKIYKSISIWVGAFIGGPLTAGYLIAENFKVFNEKGKVTKTWIYTITGTILIFAAVFLIPDSVAIPNQIIPLIYTVIAYLLVKHFQSSNISTHIASGGKTFGWWRTIVISLIGFVITAIVIFGFALLMDAIMNV